MDLKKLVLVAALASCLFGLKSFAQDPGAKPAPAPVAVAPISPVPASAIPVAAPSVSAVSGVLQKVSEAIPSSIPAGVLAILLFLLEIVVRAIPSAQPQSLLLVASGALKLVGDIVGKLSGLFDQLLQNIPKAP